MTKSLLLSKQCFLLVLTVCLFSSVFSQDAKRIFKSGQDFLEFGIYKDAIVQFKSAINLNHEYKEAYQVFSSAGYVLAVDNSQFNFASILACNPNSYIPIESIAMKIMNAVSDSNPNQKLRFGKIDGLSDEDGTFFYDERMS